MLKGDGNKNGNKINRLISKKKKTKTNLIVQHTFFLISEKTNLHVQHGFLSFFAVVFHDYNAVLYD